MKVLVVGRGAREHALAWKLASSPRVTQVFVAPGNGGIPTLAHTLHEGSAPITNVPIGERDIEALRTFVMREDVYLTVVGPESSLAAGIVDHFQEMGLLCFGPTRAAAQLETSKAFAKNFMIQYGLPTARYEVFKDHGLARTWLKKVSYPVVLKASGLAAGKGVILPISEAEAHKALKEMLLDKLYGTAGETVVIEERLHGVEVSVLGFCDGTHFHLMPPAQDHKTAFDGDQGPNTGGMGAYAPSPLLTPQDLQKYVAPLFGRVLSAMAAEGTPYVGVLYAGLMLTTEGVKILEFNARFGDPETQVLLPLLETDLFEILLACVEKRLAGLEIRWLPQSAATVVLAAQGYPGPFSRGDVIHGLPQLSSPHSWVFHAGTLRVDQQLRTDGGRVLSVAALGPDLASCLNRVYDLITHLNFRGMFFRKDIGARALSNAQPVDTSLWSEDLSTTTPAPQVVAPESPQAPTPPQDGTSSPSPQEIPTVSLRAAPPPPPSPVPMSYRDAGVDISAGNHAVELMKSAVKSTYGADVLTGIGAFGGQFSARRLKMMDDPVLVASTDGVGTKTRIAAALGRYETIGMDLVNHCINDILVQGAHPLFFLDYVAMDKLDPVAVATLVKGCADACGEAGCALLGGETAEMPGIYQPREFDLAGTIVGCVERSKLINGSRIRPGDLVLGLMSSGLHTNGYSLARRVFQEWDLTAYVPDLDTSLGDALLKPHRSYLREISLLQTASIDIRGLVHITGGGLIENPPRILSPELALRLDLGSWPIPTLFNLIQRAGHVETMEMARVFNLGLGMLVVTPRDQAWATIRLLQSDPHHAEVYPVGEILPRRDGPAVVFGEVLS